MQFRLFSRKKWIERKKGGWKEKNGTNKIASSHFKEFYFIYAKWLTFIHRHSPVEHLQPDENNKIQISQCFVYHSE